MSSDLLRVNSLKKIFTSAFFMLAISSILIGLTTMGSLASDDPDIPVVGPRAVITPQTSLYVYTAAPKFEIEAGSNTYYKVELALAKRLFDASYGNRISSSTDVNQNFYSSGFTSCSGGGDIEIMAAATDTLSTDCKVTFELPSSNWGNLQGSRVFYRVVTAMDSLGTNSRYSTTDSDWASAPYIGRTGASWFGLPHNNNAKIGGTYVVVDGKLNGKALSSDFGPRNVTGGSRFHPGLDIPVAKGTPVYAIADGTVVSVPVSTDSMHRLDIDHGQYRSGYVHLDKALVGMNEAVIAGQLIGYSGDWFEGKPDNIADHLHFDSGYSTSQIYHNPLDYVRYTDNHVISNGEGTYLHDTYTHSRKIDIVNAAGTQDIVLVAFGVTTDYDKDLNFVEVQVDNNVQAGQYFILNYNEVKNQDSSTGVVTLNNGKTFRIQPLSVDIYSDTNLAYDFYVKPADTNIDVVAKDYFFFPWDVSTIKMQEDGGPHSINVSLAEENNAPVTQSVTIGPLIIPSWAPPWANGYQIQLMVTNYDVPEATEPLKIEVKGLESGLPDWLNVEVSFETEIPGEPVGVRPGETEEVIIRMTATGDHEINADFLRENNIRVVATHGRIEALQDSFVICPADAMTVSSAFTSFTESFTSGEFCPTGTPKVTILAPSEGGKVPVNKIYDVQVFAVGADDPVDASLVVENLSTGSSEILYTYIRDGDTLTFKWTPEERDAQYALIAKVDGFEDSDARKVTAVNDEVIFIQPVEGRIAGSQEVIVIVDAPAEAMKVVLEIDPTGAGAGGDMIKTVDAMWRYSGWIPSEEVDYYNLTATAHLPDGSKPYAIIRVEPIPDDPTIEVPSSVQYGESVDVVVTAPRAFSVALMAGGAVDELGQDGDLWRFKWTPDAAGEFIIWAVASYAAHADKVTEHLTVQVVDEETNYFDLTITSASPVNVGQRTKATIEAGRALSRVEIVVINPHGDEENRFGYELESCSEIPQEDWNYYDLAVGALWNANDVGEYTIYGHAWDCEGHHAWTEVGYRVTVVVPPPADPLDKGSWTWINSYSFLWENKQKVDWSYDTEIPVDQYICGVIGFDARGGDIGERYDGNIINVYLDTNGYDKNNSWWVHADFNTWHLGMIDDWADYDWIADDNAEEWDVNLICFDRSKIAQGKPEGGKPIFTKALTGLGDAQSTATGVNANAYTCGIAGFDSGRGDINEKGDGNIIQTYLDVRDGEWYVTADFNTHVVATEDWSVDLLCVENGWAAIDTPAVGKPFVFKSYWNHTNKNEGALGDNIDYATEFLVDEWGCGIAGFAAMDGDIDEGKAKDRILIRVEMEENTDGKWHILADFRTHNDNESWNVNVMCVAKEGVSIQSVQPYLFTGTHPDGKLYGPGMKVDFTDSHEPDATHYRVQYSTDGGSTWNNIYTAPRELSDGSWFNHHGNYTCGWEADAGEYQSKYGHCLAENQTYFYRVGLMANIDDDEPINGTWSQPVSATSYKWPVYFDVHVTSPASHADYTYYTVYLTNVHGENLRVTWELESVLGAYGTKWSCSSTTCAIKVYPPQESNVNSTITTASVEPSPGVTVVITGTDEYYQDGKIIQHTYQKAVFLKSDPGGGDDDRDDDNRVSSFTDVPPDHWAYTYIEYLSDLQITSGCTTAGDPQYCPGDSLSRAQMAVFTVRSRHPEDPGYVPLSPEKVIFIDEEIQPIADISSTSPDVAYRPEIYWYDKYTQELYDDGVISGCSTNPVKFCPNDSTTRAQVTVFVVRLLHGEEYTPVEPDQQIYNDAPLFDLGGNRIWSSKWINQAHQDGLIQDCETDLDNMLFRPEDPVTRAEAACMMYYALQAKGE